MLANQIHKLNNRAMDQSESRLPHRLARADSHNPPDWVNPDAMFFITINCHSRGFIQLTENGTPQQVFTAIETYVGLQRWWPVMLILMPDHLHLLASFPWNFPNTMGNVIQDWKRYLARNAGIRWQRDYFDHRIRNEADLQDKWEYMRDNPVKAGLVEDFNHWPHVWFPDRRGWP